MFDRQPFRVDRLKSVTGFMNAILLTLILVATVVLAAGCSGESKRQWKYRSLDEAMRIAFPENLRTSNADERRGAVTRLGECSRFDDDNTFVVLDAVARTDPESQIRCIAIRGLARYDDDRPVGTMLKILQATQEPEHAIPPDNDVRWEALQALLALAEKGVLRGDAVGIARDVCIRLAEFDPSRNVRIVATEMLGSFQDRAVLAPLIRLVRSEDFAIAERAELSLIALTGVTHEFDADAWETWVANTDAPFARAGEIPQTTRPAPPSWWDKKKRAVRRALKLGNKG